MFSSFLGLSLFGKGSQPSRHAGGYEADRVEHQNFFERDVAVSAIAVVHLVSPPFLKGRCHALQFPLEMSRDFERKEKKKLLQLMPGCKNIVNVAQTGC